MKKDFTTTMTTKGQITVPKEIREKFNLSEGSKLKVVYNDQQIIFKPITIADEFEDLILADIAKEGLEGYQAEAMLLAKKAEFDKAFERLLEERKSEGKTAIEDSDVFDNLGE